MSFKKFIKRINITGYIMGTLVLLVFHFYFGIPLFMSLGCSLVGYAFPIINWIGFHGIDLK